MQQVFLRERERHFDYRTSSLPHEARSRSLQPFNTISSGFLKVKTVRFAFSHSRIGTFARRSFKRERFEGRVSSKVASGANFDCWYLTWSYSRSSFGAGQWTMQETSYHTLIYPWMSTLSRSRCPSIVQSLISLDRTNY